MLAKSGLATVCGDVDLTGAVESDLAVGAVPFEGALGGTLIVVPLPE